VPEPTALPRVPIEFHGCDNMNGNSVEYIWNYWVVMVWSSVEVFRRSEECIASIIRTEPGKDYEKA
jgi:hypothetical protein